MNKIRITDIIFFTVLIGMIIVVFTYITLNITRGIDIPTFVTHYWIFLLMPVVIAKIFFPNSKFTNWLEKDRDFTKK